MKPEPLIKAYSQIEPEEYRCLLSLMEEWRVSKPFVGKKVLMNAHLTLITLTMVHALWLGGAEVDITAISPLVVHGPEKGKFDTVTPLLEAEVCYYPNGAIPENKKRDYYDVTFDCGAELLGLVIPKKGYKKVGVLSFHPFIKRTNGSSVTSVSTTLLLLTLHNFSNP